MPSLAQFFQTWGAMISTLALLATLGVIIWYSYETRRLRKATVKQTELQLTPYLILNYAVEKEIPEYTYLLCKNIGNTSALNVRVETFEVKDNSGKLMWKVDFNPLYVLEPNKHKEVVFNITYGDGEWKAMAAAFGTQTFFPFFPKEFKVEEYPLIVHYENLENVSFETKAHVKISEREIEILKIVKVKK